MAKVTSFTAGYGFSGSINGQWHKFNCEITIEIEGTDNVQQVKEKAWNTCYQEIEKQIQELTNN